MGFFDFIKDAGDKVVDAVTPDNPAEHIEDPVDVSPERMNELRQQHILRRIAELDIDGEQVQVAVQDDTVVLTGSAPSQEALEKMVLCAGNQRGIAQVDCRLEVPEPAVAPEPATAPEPEVASAAAAAASHPEAPAEFYTVQKGDTLGAIAQRYYGAASKYHAIFEANQPMLKDPDRIYPGQTLRIPNID
jgi:nucleoid-associated protein YgaU